MVKAMLFGLVMAAGCGETTDAPEVATDVYEYTCIADETHIFDEVQFTPGEWVDAQMWYEISRVEGELGDDGQPVVAWSGQVPSLTADGYARVTCQLYLDAPSIVRYRLLVRR